MPENSAEFVELAADIVAAYVSHNRVSMADVPDLIVSVHAALSGLNSETVVAPVAMPLVPAVSIKKSITAEHLICLEDGKPFKSLKRHLNAKYGMTPDQYRAKWGLSADYPMTAPAYAERRSVLAKSFGLGQDRSAAAAAKRAEA